ncbi:anoctamin-1, partial [Clonorchis sinensis]
MTVLARQVTLCTSADDYRSLNHWVEHTTVRPFTVRELYRFLESSVVEQGFFSLWRGNTATLSRIFPYAAIQYSAHERYKHALGIDLPDMSHMRLSDLRLRRFLAGCMAGTTCVVTTYPLDFARARMAVTTSKRYHNVIHALRTVTTEEGAWALYRGFIPAILGIIPYSGIAFFTFETLKEYRLNRHMAILKTRPEKLKPFENLCCGAFSGVLGQTASYPLDIVRRRMQNAAVTVCWTLSQHSRDVVGKLHIITMLDVRSATARYSFTYESIVDSMGRFDTTVLAERIHVRGTERLPNCRRRSYTRTTNLDNLTSFRRHKIERRLDNSVGYSMRSIKTIIQHLPTPYKLYLSLMVLEKNRSIVPTLLTILSACAIRVETEKATKVMRYKAKHSRLHQLYYRGFVQLHELHTCQTEPVSPALRTDDSVRLASALRAASARHMAPVSSGPGKMRTNRLATERLADPDVRRTYQNRLLGSLPNAPPSDVNSHWDEIASSLHSAGNFACGTAPPGARKHWISTRTLTLLKSRRSIPAGPENNLMQRVIRRQVKKAKEIEEPQESGNARKLFQLIRATGPRKPPVSETIKDRNGVTILNKEELRTTIVMDTSWRPSGTHSSLLFPRFPVYRQSDTVTVQATGMEQADTTESTEYSWMSPYTSQFTSRCNEGMTGKKVESTTSATDKFDHSILKIKRFAKQRVLGKCILCETRLPPACLVSRYSATSSTPVTHAQAVTAPRHNRERIRFSTCNFSADDTLVADAFQNEYSILSSFRSLRNPMFQGMSVNEIGLRALQSNSTLVYHAQEYRIAVCDSRSIVWQPSGGLLVKNRDLYFTDGKRSIDYVLAYSRTKTTEVHAAKRTAFLKGLARELVEIEVEDCCGQILGRTAVGPSPPTEPIISARIQPTSAAIPVYPEPNPQQKWSRKESTRGQPSSMDRYRFRAEHEESALFDLSDLVFVKLHAPWKTMERYAEMFNFRKPLKMDPEMVKLRPRPSCSDCCDVDKSVLKPLRNTFTWPFQKQRLYLFDIPQNQDEFFTAVERAMVLDYILRRTPCVFEDNPELDETTSSNNSPGFNGRRRPAEIDVGITKMLSDGVFSAAYPLHELSESRESFNCVNNRILLKRYWASYKSFGRPQPLDYIRYYFGEAVAFYFAWLGFYTSCLAPVAFLGVLIFLFGLIGMFNDPIVKDVCEYGSSIIMCPLCDHVRCQFWRLNSSCLRSKLTRLVDNEGTVLFGVIMALWAILFLELWKRRQVSLAYQWSVYSLEPVDQPPRPEFLALLQKGFPSKLNPISGLEEPVVPFWRMRVPCFCVSFTSVLFGVLLTLACLVGVILYKLVMKVVFYQQPNEFVQSVAGMLTTITGSVINLILIFILKFIYNRLAIKLNDLENHRTQVEYDNSLTLKLYLLQFVNYYSSIFYIAFIQGTTAAVPGADKSIVQSTGCDQGDCLFELFLQLVIIMVGKQLLNFIQETMMPVILRLIRKVRADCQRRKASTTPETADQLEKKLHTEVKTRSDRLLACRSDYTLLDPGSRPLFDEYLEMMIQYGFITMFVPAFPLAPFFGMLNNLFEIRGDAKKFVNQYRRPVLERVGTIGIWYSILLVLSSLAIRTNACVIAFSTQFIDRWVYRMHYSADHTDAGFKNFTLSYMDSSRFPGVSNTTYCRYDDYRKPPWEDPEMSHTLIFYHVLAVKFIFVFIFEIWYQLTALVWCFGDTNVNHMNGYTADTQKIAASMETLRPRVNRFNDRQFRIVQNGEYLGQAALTPVFVLIGLERLSVATVLTSLIAAMIPDVPKRVKKRIYFEANETNRLILDAELHHKQKRPGRSLRWDLKKETLGKLRDAEEEEDPLAFLHFHQTFANALGGTSTVGVNRYNDTGAYCMLFTHSADDSLVGSGVLECPIIECDPLIGGQDDGVFKELFVMFIPFIIAVTPDLGQ